MRMVSAVFTAVMLAGTASTGAAEPLMTIKDGTPAPGVVVRWSGEGKKVELTLKDDADITAVAAAIEAGLERIRVKVKAGQLLAIGLSQEDLLQALTGIEVGGDDLDILAAAAEADDDIDTGSSLRAKKVSVDSLLTDRKTTIVGRVVAVTTGAFPRARVKVRVLRGPTGPLKRALRKGRTVTVYPRLSKKKAALDLNDPATVANLGAWFLKKDDRVRVKVGEPTQGGYVADLIVR